MLLRDSHKTDFYALRLCRNADGHLHAIEFATAIGRWGKFDQAFAFRPNLLGAFGSDVLFIREDDLASYLAAHVGSRDRLTMLPDFGDMPVNEVGLPLVWLRSFQCRRCGSRFDIMDVQPAGGAVCETCGWPEAKAQAVT